MGTSVAVAVVGACLQAAFVRADLSGRSVAAAVLKTLAALAFVAVGSLGAASGATHGSPGAWVVVLGLALGAVGDLLHALRFVPAVRRRQPHLFAAGAVSFLAGHLCYLAFLCPRCDRVVATLEGGLAVWLVVLVLLSQRVRVPQPRLRGLGALYLLVLSLMLAFACADLVCGPTAGSLAFAAGSVLFLVSDSLLAANTFVPARSPRVRAWSLGTYYAAQTLIALSLSLGW